jgi:flagellar motor switch/type III secretory pathway protein FliN
MDAGLIIGSTIEMEPMSFWQLVENSPEWVTAIAAVLLAIVTSIVIYCQLRVMKGQARVMRFQATVLKWQARQSVRLQRAQNALIRLQHEHEWARLNNQERDQILKSARKLHIAVRCLLIEAPSSAEPLHWDELRDAVHELNARLNILDIATFAEDYDPWFFSLKEYVDEVLKAVIEEPNIQAPGPETKKKLEDADKRHNPIKIASDIEIAIRTELSNFKMKWHDLLC